MTDWYAYVNNINNTLTNRNILLSRLTIDPNLIQYAPSAVNYYDDYTIVVVFDNILTDFNDAMLTQKMIDIIFNYALPDEINTRGAIADFDPSSYHDYYSNFAPGSSWLNTITQLRYECIDNTIDNAIWRIIPYVGSTGLGTGATGSYPYDGSILQYDTNASVWISQPGRYQSLTINPTNMIVSNTSPPVIGTGGVYLFSNGLTQEMFGHMLIPNSFLENSDIIFNIGFETTTAGTGNVIWGIDYDWKNIGDVFSSYNGITAGINTNGLQNQYLNIQLPPILGIGKNILSIIRFIIYRDGTNDTYPNDVVLLYVNISYNANGTGSSQNFVK